MEEYDEVVSRQPGGKLTKRDAQRARYGSRLDEERYILWQSIWRFVRITTWAASVAATLGEIYQLFHGK